MLYDQIGCACGRLLRTKFWKLRPRQGRSPQLWALDVMLGLGVAWVSSKCRHQRPSNAIRKDQLAQVKSMKAKLKKSATPQKKEKKGKRSAAKDKVKPEASG